MLMTITTTHRPATDLGYLLVKNPARTQSFSLAHGEAHVFYPEATEARCTAALLLDLDPVGLSRGWRGSSGPDGLLGRYVNDRPYVASSFLAVAIARVFGSAMKPGNKDRPELADTPIPLEVELAAVACRRGGEELVRRLFGPLGYEVETRRIPLDEAFPAWGQGPYVAVRLTGTRRLCELLVHLYVLLPVLDDDKHYWVGDDELERLLDKGEGWLAEHPERALIVERALKRQRRLVREALARLVADDEPDPDEREDEVARDEEAGERRLSLAEQRALAVIAALEDAGARAVIDLGCGDGKLVRALAARRGFERIGGMDVSPRALELAAARLDGVAAARRERVTLFQGSLTYRDARLAGWDAACAVEVIEHLDPPRLPAFEQVVFAHARPPTVIVTTPNVEYNVRFPGLAAGRLRHGDHRFEWTRAELAAWARGVAERHGYQVRIDGIGEADPDVGAPTQLAVFTR